MACDESAGRSAVTGDGGGHSAHEEWQAGMTILLSHSHSLSRSPARLEARLRATKLRAVALHAGFSATERGGWYDEVVLSDSSSPRARDRGRLVMLQCTGCWRRMR